MSHTNDLRALLLRAQQLALAEQKSASDAAIATLTVKLASALRHLEAHIADTERADAVCPSAAPAAAAEAAEKPKRKT